MTNAGLSLDEMLDADMAERKKALYRHKMPAKLDLAGMLGAMTTAELDDIRYNLNVSGASKLKKAELVERLKGEIIDFSRQWFPSILVEEYYAFKHIIDEGGKTLKLRDDDVRLDYLRGLGLVSCGKEGDELAWFMPEEIIAEFKKLDSPAYLDLADLNSELARLTAGCLYYYGYMNYEELYTRVMSYIDEGMREGVSFRDFVGVLLNASCWKNTIVALPTGVKYYTLIDENKLEDEQLAHANLDFARFEYPQVHEAGTDNYIDATDGYKALAQYIMQAYEYDVLKSADIVGEIIILLQNGGNLQEAFEYLEELGMMGDKEKMDAIVPLLIALNNGLHLWPLKGHTPEEIMAASGGGRVIPFADATKKKVGRNDPCPCGSGKKYKNCCLRKDEN